MNAQTPCRRGRVRLITLALALALAAGACRTSNNATTGSTTSTAPPRDGGSVVMAVDQETTGWQPQLSNWANAGYWVGSSVIEPLVTYNEHGETIMWLAESVTPTAPGQFDSWVIKVKPNITFHNGEKLDSSVMMANFDLITNGKSISSVLLGPKFKGFTPLDDLSVRVDLNGSWADFPSFLAGGAGMMTAKAMLAAPFGGLDHPIGTGPFVFESWTPNVSFKATKNKAYWRAGEPHLDSIEFRPILDNQKALTALHNGDVDMIVTTKAQDVANAGTGFDVHTDFDTEKTFVQVSTAQHPDRPLNPLTNPHARRALAYGTDRDAIRDQVGAGQQLTTSTQPMVAGTPWAVPEDQTGYYEFDVTKARAEVEAYKAETGNQTIEFELDTTLAPDDLAIANSLADQWSAIGITAHVRGKDTQANTTDSVFGKFEAATARNYAYPNPDVDSVFFLSSSAKGPGNLSVNFAQLKDPVIDAAVAESQATTDRDRQRNDWLTITRQINGQAIDLWLYNTPYAVINTPTIRGLESLDSHAFATSLARPWLWGSVWRT